MTISQETRYLKVFADESVRTKNLNETALRLAINLGHQISRNGISVDMLSICADAIPLEGRHDFVLLGFIC